MGWRSSATLEQSQDPSVNPHGAETPFHEMTWTAKQLTSLFADPAVAREPKQLDIEVDDYVGVNDDYQTSTFILNQYNKYRLIDIFGIKEDGQVNAEEMLSTIARLQGQAHMNLDKLNMLTIQEVQRSLKDIQDVLTAPPRRPRPPSAPAAAPRAGPEGAPGTGATLRPAPPPSVIGAAFGRVGDRAAAAPEARGDEAKAATASTAWASAPSVESEKSRAETAPAATVERGRGRRRAPTRQGAEAHGKPRGEP
ncbi:unnamed protein product [Prorocentrum cordatum]|uniref:Calmodulin n=1 Tax=Prorocentrum cordatum TaxID=2364126 RepID=A0ABN9RQR1_9DINO|nr:unnamed protein product [Polarella glacialis]